MTSSDNITWTGTFTPSAAIEDATNILSLTNTYTDIAGNTGVTATTANYTVDTVAPTIVITSNKSALKSGETATITFTLSESSSNFVIGDIVAAGCTLSALTGAVPGTVYTAVFTPTAGSTTTATFNVAASTFTDAAGNNNTAATQLSVTVDTVAPTIVITSNKTALAAGETATITFTLSESSSDFAVGDVTVVGGTLSVLAGSGTSYTATFTPATNSTTTATFNVAAGVFTDSAGNSNLAATQLSVTVANTPAFGTTTSNDSGFTVQISNYDALFTYAGTATPIGAVVVISNTGLVTVSRVAANTSSTATITTARANYVSGSAQVTATSNTAPLITGTPTPPSSSGASTVNLYNAGTGEPTGTAVPFPGFNGPVKVVSGDFNGDGVAELIAGAGFGGGPAIAILNSQTGEVMESFFAFDPAFTGGVFVAVQDTNGDGILDIIASAGPGGGPEVRIFDGANLNVLRAFFAYAEDFSGGVSVATLDFNNAGILELGTGAGPGGAPHVKVYDGATNAIISQWYAYPASFTGGVFVAVGDIGNDGTFEVVTGAGPSGAPVVAVWDPFTGALLAQFMAYAEDFTGGVRVAVNDGNGDGVPDIITGAGPGGGPQVNVFNFPALDLLFSFYSGEATNAGGVFVS